MKNHETQVSLPLNLDNYDKRRWAIENGWETTWIQDEVNHYTQNKQRWTWKKVHHFFRNEPKNLSLSLRS